MSTRPDQRPQFRHLPTGHIVFPDGYAPEELERLPENYWPDRDREDAIRAVKKSAEEQILAIAPIWRQLNDIREPTPEGDARLAAIDAIRAQSNAAEAAILEGLNNG